ncbi:FAD-binding oxidoreductase [Egbenema bharatensis]|uniref:FAD-binding oxidoreductase n=1 Tax=Egbenema bharatensis TaxID=3463334 RepID=UPI003A873FB0
MPPIAQTLESRLNPDAICPWDAVTPELRSQLSQAVVPHSPIEGIVYPQTEAELAEVIACARSNRWRLLICGSGSKLHWGGLAEGIQLVVSTARLDRLIEHAAGDMTMTAEAGMKLADLQNILAKSGQFLAIDPAYPESATLGGIVATADTGTLRQRYGGIRDLLIGLSIVRTDGKVAKAGGRVVKNVAGYDLMKLFTGSYGTLGVISQVTFRVYPLPPASRSVVLTGEAEKIAQVTATLLASGLSPSAIELLAPVTTAALDRGEGMGLAVRFQGIEVSVEKQADYVLQMGQALMLEAGVLKEQDEAALWQQLQEQMGTRPKEVEITCKIGVLPSNAVGMLEQVSTLAPLLMTGMIHAASGLGLLRFRSTLPSDVLNQMRDRCQVQGGFLTIREAPVAFKQSIDVWGYPGNAMELMRGIKHQFDPEKLFSPGRFVGGI